MAFGFVLVSVFVFADDGDLNGVLHLPSQRPRYTTPFLVQDGRCIQHNRGRMLGDIASGTKDDVTLDESIGKADLEISLLTPGFPSVEVENRIVAEFGGDLVQNGVWKPVALVVRVDADDDLAGIGTPQISVESRGFTEGGVAT